MKLSLISPWALLLLVWLAGCSKTEPAPEPIRAVRTITLGAEATGGTREYAADVRARVESRLACAWRASW